MGRKVALKTLFGGSPSIRDIKKKRRAGGQSPSKNQARERVVTGLMASPLVRLAVVITTAAVAALGAWLRLVDIQLASIQLLAVQAADGSNSLVLT